MKRIASIGLTVIFVFVLAASAHAFLDSNVSKAKEFMQAGMYPQAIALLEKEIFGGEGKQGNPTNAEAHFLIGKCYVHEGRLGSADERFASAVKLKPDYGYQVGKVYKSAGDEQLNRGRISQADGLLKKAVKYDPRLRPKIANELFERGKRGNNEQLFSLAVSHNSGLRGQIADHYNALSQQAKNDEARMDMLQIASRYDSKYSAKFKENAQTLGRAYLDKAKELASIPGKEAETDKHKNLARKYLGDSVVDEKLPDKKVYGPSDHPFELKAEEQTPFRICTPRGIRVYTEFFSSNDYFEIHYDNAVVVHMWTDEELPRKIDSCFRFRAKKDVKVLLRVTKI